MANPEHVEILRQGVYTWNEWRKKNNFIKIDLANTNLSGLDLNDAFLQEADLRGANLSGTLLINAQLFRSDLSRARLSRANLTGAHLREAILFYIEFTGTKLRQTRLANTSFAYADLSAAIDVESVIHRGPSSIDIATIRNFRGNLPSKFLRGCGLSDLEIECAKLATPDLSSVQVTNITYKIHQLYLGGGIQYYSCFISYSSKDQEFAEQLHNDLQNNGVRCWFDREDLKIGDQIRTTIDSQIRLRDKLLVILSENSIKSEWVGDEVEGALEEENKSNRLVLFPIRLDETVLNTRDDWAAKIKRRRHIGDFSNWRDKSRYQNAFERLLRDLKASSEIGSKDEMR